MKENSARANGATLQLPLTVTTMGGAEEGKSDIELPVI
uniref:Type VI secretion system tip protein VgrG n=1 Tax=Schistosoma curassoni TaxID=6186 RepID=A0A183L1P2_9TREM